MNIANLSEQLKDVPQNKLVDYAKNPNSVVPQFLALAEIQRRQQLGGQTQAPQSTVANDVLMQAQPMLPQGMPPQQAMMQQAPQNMSRQLPENQPGVAQLPSGMPQGMAGGGIVAFADGGMADDDDETDGEMSRLFPTDRLAGVTDMLASIPSGLRSLANRAKTAMSGAVSQGESGIDALLAKVKHLESRGQDYDSKGNILTSPKGAEGSMQVMRHTQRDPGYGVAPAKSKDPRELERVGQDYFKAMLDKFEDPKVAAMAYNWGPGNVEKWLASGKKTPIPEETRKYASNFAEGGIARLAEGGYTSFGEEAPYDPNSPSITKTFGNMLGNPLERLRNATFGVGARSNKELYAEADKPRPSEQDFRNFDQAAALFQAEQKPKASEAPIPAAKTSETPPKTIETPPPAKEESASDRYFKAMEEDIFRRAEAAKEEGDTNKYMALMQAGLKMMSSTSPYALANIGAGGQEGVSTYAALQKGVRDTEKDIAANRLGLIKYKAAAEGAAETREANRLYRESTLGLKASDSAVRQEDRALDRIRQLDADITRTISAEVKGNPILQMRPDVEQIIAQRVAAAKSNHPLYAKFYEQANLGQYGAGAPASSGFPPLVKKDGKTYVLQPNGKYIQE